MSLETKKSQTRPYTYQFTLEPRQPRANAYGEVSNKELQSYINDILGIGKAKKPESDPLTV